MHTLVTQLNMMQDAEQHLFLSLERLQELTRPGVDNAIGRSLVDWQLVAELFDDEKVVDLLPTTELATMMRQLGYNPVGPRSLIRYRLLNAIKAINSDDEAIAVTRVAYTRAHS